MKELEQFTKYVKKILVGIGDGYVDTFDKSKYLYILWDGSGFLFIPNSVRQEYGRAFKILKSKAKYSKRLISDAKIEARFQDFLFKMHSLKKPGPFLSKEIQNLLDSIRRMAGSRYLVIVPIVNVEITTEFVLGNVEITTLTDARCMALQAQYGIKFPTRPVKNPIQGIRDSSDHSTVAIVVVESSDFDKAHDLALQATDQVLNVLRLYDPEFRGLVRGEELGQVERTIFMVDIGTGASNQSENLCNMKEPAETVDSETIEILNAQYLPIINSMVQKAPKELSRMQNDLLIAIYWIGNSVRSSSRTDKFIKYIIAMDTLLAQGRNDKSEFVARRYAAIMRHGRPTDELLKKYHEVQAYYSKRNEVVHAGLTYVEEEMLKNLQLDTHGIIFKVLQYCERYLTIEELQTGEFPIDDTVFPELHARNVDSCRSRLTRRKKKNAARRKILHRPSD